MKRMAASDGEVEFMEVRDNDAPVKEKTSKPAHELPW